MQSVGRISALINGSLSDQLLGLHAGSRAFLEFPIDGRFPEHFAWLSESLWRNSLCVMALSFWAHNYNKGMGATQFFMKCVALLVARNGFAAGVFDR